MKWLILLLGRLLAVTISRYQQKNSMFQKLVIIALQTVIFKTIEFKIKFRQTWQIDS